MSFQPPDGRSYEMDADGKVLKIDGKKPTNQDMDLLVSRGYSIKVAITMPKKKEDK